MSIHSDATALAAGEPTALAAGEPTALAAGSVALLTGSTRWAIAVGGDARLVPSLRIGLT